MLSHGKVTRIAPSVALCVGLANLISELLTIIVSGHSCSVPDLHGHHGRLSLVLCHDQLPATALLPMTSALLSIVTPSLAVITAWAIAMAEAEGR